MKWDMTSKTKHGRIFALMCRGWTSVRTCDGQDVLTFCQRVSELRTKVGPLYGFIVESRKEAELPPGAKAKVKQHRILWLHPATEAQETARRALGIKLGIDPVMSEASHGALVPGGLSRHLVPGSGNVAGGSGSGGGA